ncbi:MAG: adenosylcobinamide-GDP ribazoletransferase [Dehalococcoidales bacterium]
MVVGNQESGGKNTYSFLAALQLLTGIPVPLKRELSPAQLGRATVFFPLVGLIIGGILAGLNRVFNLFLPASAVNALLIAALVILTGAIHLDGLADTCDGMAGHKPVEERWRIMRDSRSGAFGVVGVALVLLVKYVLLSNIPAEKMTAVLLFMPAASRWAMVYSIYAFRYARPEGLGSAYKSATRWPQFLAATIFTAGLAAAFYPLFQVTGFLIMAGVWLTATGLAFYLKRKFAGLTGDSYGAINEVSELAALLAAIIIFTNAPGMG